MSAICPGQDTRYWKPGDIFEIACGGCGGAVEFFKDDVRRRCPNCDTVVQNPKITMGCAQWCEHAKACLGYDPKELLNEEPAPSDGSLLDKLTAALEGHLVDDPTTLDQALGAVEEERGRLGSKVTGRDHRLRLVAALLQGMASRDSHVAKEIMNEADMDRSTIDDVCTLLGM